MARATRLRLKPGSGPRRHDPQQGLTASQARRRPAPPATARLHPRPLEPTPRTANRTDLGQPGRARPLSAPRRSRSLCQPSARAPPSTLSLSTVGHRQIPIDPNAEPGPRGFLVWGRGCQAPISRLAPLHSEFLGSTWKPVSSSRPTSRTAARAGAVKIGRRSQAASLRPRARWHAGWWSR